MRPRRLINLVGVILLVGIVGWPYFISGVKTNGSLVINGGLDTLWHLSLIAESSHFWPLHYPGLPDTILFNYHYFSDFAWGMLSKITGLSNLTIYFRVAPIVSLVLAFIGIYKLAASLSTDKIAPYLSVIISVFSGSAAFLIPIFTGVQGAWYPSSFGPDHFLDQSTNIHTIFGYVGLVWGLYFLNLFFKTKQLKYQLLGGVIIGLLFSIKSFFFIPLFLGMATAFGIVALRNRKLFLLPIVISGIVAAIGWSVISNRSSTPPLVFAPGWLSLKVIEEPNRFPVNDWLLRLQVYSESNNWLRIIQIYLQATLIVIIGGAWLTLWGGAWIIEKSKYNHEIRWVMGVTVIFSFILPFLIVPNPDNFNTVQFFQPGLIILNMCLGLWLAKRRWYWTVLLIVLLTPTTLKDLTSPTRNSSLVIDFPEVQALTYLRENTPLNAVVLAQPQSNTFLLKVPAIAERRAFASGEKSADLVGIDFLTPKTQQENILGHALPLPKKVTHLLLEKDFSQLIDWINDKQVRLVFENSDYIIFANENTVRAR